MKMSRNLTLIAALMLTGCGTTPTERSVSGAGIGAGAGAVVGAVTGLTILEAAALGATAGALTGALTKPEDVNLGQPAWKQSAADPERKAVSNGTVAEVQHGLARLGYAPGPADGVCGPRTETAIRQYQKDHGLLVDGRPSMELADHIRSQGS